MALSRFVAVEYVPASQVIAALAPAGQYRPAKHASHAVALLDDWNVPPAHGSHSDCPVVAVKLPGAHGVGSIEPVEHDEPAGHAVHWSGAVRDGESP